LVAAIAIPSYDTPYYGTSGFDGMSATHEWTPYRDYPLTWKQVFLTPWLDPNERETLTLHGFPNLGMNATKEWYGGPIILEEEGTYGGRTCYPGDFANRISYTSYAMMGRPLQIVANVVKITQDVNLPYLDLMFERAADGVLQGAQQDEGMKYQSYILTINEYFSEGGTNSVAAKQKAYMGSLDSSNVNSIFGQMTRNEVYPFIWYRPDWPDAKQGQSLLQNLIIEYNPKQGEVTPYNGQYPTGSEVVLYAQAKDGYRFAGWEGDVTGTEPSITITMDEDKIIQAVFEPIEYAPPAQKIADWELTQEAINGQISDLSANTHTATAVGNVTFESGMGARFDGSDGYLSVADADSLDMQEPTTISVWIWPMGATPFAKLVVKPYAAYASPWEMYAIDLGSGGDTPRFIVTDGIAGGNIAVAANSDVKLQTGQWYYIVAVYDGESILLYLDGSLIAQESVPFQIGTNDEPLCIGGRMGLNTFDGYICDVKIYQGAFTPEQVSGAFSRDRNGGLAGHWLFERPYTTEVMDAVSGQKAELVDQPEWGEGWAAEYFVRLDSGQQAVQIPMDGSTAEAGTIGLWVQPEKVSDTETASALQLLFGHAVNSDDNRITLYTVESTDAEGNTVHKLALGLGDNAALKDNIAQLTPGQLYHIALTWDRTTYAVFVDGVRRDAGTFSGLAALEAFADVGNFGSASGRAYASGFRGLVDEVRLYRRALGADEIERLFLTHTVNENRSIEFVVSGYDQAGNRISYTAAKLPDGATFDELTQTFSWRPDLYNTAGNYEVVFAAADQPEQTVTIAVRDVPLAGWYFAFLEQRGLH